MAGNTDSDAVLVFDDLDRWQRHEATLESRGIPLPLEHRSSWLREIVEATHWFVVAQPESREDGRVVAGVPVGSHPTRALPGHERLRVTRFGNAAYLEALADILEALKGLVLRRSKHLGVTVEVFAADPQRREEIEAIVRAAGYQPADRQPRYRHTARLDLTLSEEALLASFTASCRRFIRDPEKKGFQIEPIRDERWAGRMDDLWHETFSRTGSSPPPRAWRKRIAYARRHPDLYRIVGTFGPGYPRERSLAAFCAAMHNGDHAVYSDGASTRTLDAAVALLYAPMWALIRWSRSVGCDWFDMGGITGGTYEDGHDPRGGIADFKRRFTDDVIEVGDAWTFAPPTPRTWVAERIRRSATRVRRILTRLKRTE